MELNIYIVDFRLGSKYDSGVGSIFTEMLRFKVLAIAILVSFLTWNWLVITGKGTEQGLNASMSTTMNEV